MASATATAALRPLRLKVVATATSNPPYSSSSPLYSCKLFLHPTLHSNKGLVFSCSALSLRSGPHFRPGLFSRHYPFARENKGKNRRNVVVASLFGVGAPEALVIGVVALLVFGPKGLAEVARNLGKTLRAFQPMIRELQEVSKEFKSTLEREIGLDEVASSPANYNSDPVTATNQSPPVDPNGKPTSGAYSSEELLKVTEEQLAASASTVTTTADAPPPTTNSQVPEVSSTPSEATPVEATPVEAAAVEATPAEGPPSISDSSSETKSSEKQLSE